MPSSPSDGEGGTRGPWPRFPQLCEYGLRYPPKGGRPSPVRADQVATAIAFLSMFEPTKTGRISSYCLKHAAERYGGRRGLCSYVSNGALIAAALQLGFVVEEYPMGYGPQSPNAKIGVGLREFKKFSNTDR